MCMHAFINNLRPFLEKTTTTKKKYSFKFKCSPITLPGVSVFLNGFPNEFLTLLPAMMLLKFTQIPAVKCTWLKWFFTFQREREREREIETDWVVEFMCGYCLRIICCTCALVWCAMIALVFYAYARDKERERKRVCVRSLKLFIYILL